MTLLTLAISSSTKTTLTFTKIGIGAWITGAACWTFGVSSSVSASFLGLVALGQGLAWLPALIEHCKKGVKNDRPTYQVSITDPQGRTESQRPPAFNIHAYNGNCSEQTALNKALAASAAAARTAQQKPPSTNPLYVSPEEGAAPQLAARRPPAFNPAFRGHFEEGEVGVTSQLAGRRPPAVNPAFRSHLEEGEAGVTSQLAARRPPAFNPAFRGHLEEGEAGVTQR